MGGGGGGGGGGREIMLPKFFETFEICSIVAAIGYLV